MTTAEAFRRFNAGLHTELAAWVAATIGGTAKVLDAGCGSGGLGAAIARALPPGSRMTLVDRHEGRLSEAQGHFAAEGLEAEFVLADYASLEATEESFDAVWCSHALHAQDDALAAVRALVRLLRPGGTLFVREDSLLSGFDLFDFGVGRPGLGYRMKALRAEEFAVHTFDAVRQPYRRGYRSLLREAGIAGDALKTFLVQVDGPFDEAQRIALREILTDVEDRERLCSDDAEAYRSLFEEGGEHDLLARDDVSFLRMASVYWGRKPAGGHTEGVTPA